MRLLRDAVREAVRTLTDAGVESAEFDAVALAACAGKTTTSEVHKMVIMGAPVPEGFDDLVSERARRVPLQHLTGKAGFRRLELSVGPGVFIPRFETELTAALAIAFLRKPRDGAQESGSNLGTLQRTVPRFAGSGGDTVPRFAGLEGGTVPRFAGENLTRSLGLRVVDLCSGSGAIALAVKDEVPQAEVHGVELSDLAHAWAIRNRDDLGLDVDLRLGDATLAFPELEAAVDVVVSNPPYIPEGSIPNDPEVREHDPEVALYGGSSDGLRIPLEVAARAAVLLRPGGFFVMEHADVQGDSLAAALRTTGLWQDVQDHLDLNGRPRAVTAVRAP
ncbi:MAG TPA: HemK/PrmC family methyltransferase [Dermatophilaceae bacterium]|nr:HemK/PrmC family methyltransferase [Dermatophilaceae bacterium]